MTGNVIISGCPIYLDATKENTVQAIAIANGEICFTGTLEQAEAFMAEDTKHIKLEGGCVLPAFMDGHVHAPGTWLDKLFGVALYDCVSEEQYLDEVRKAVKRNSDAKIITGQGWENGFFYKDGKNIGPTREMLDEISTEIPILLTSVDVHSMWLNSKAMELCGIDENTPDVHGGYIERYIDGTPSGTLREEAQELAKALVRLYPPSKEQYMQAVLKFQEQLHSLGIVGIVNMFFGSIAEENAWQALGDLDREGKLKLRLNGVVNASPLDSPKDVIERVRSIRKDIEGTSLKLQTVKVFLDGVVEGKTAFLKQPYEKGAGMPEGYRSESIWSDFEINELTAACDEFGLQMHFHTTGDAAVDQACRAVEYARNLNGDKGNRHVITHLHVVDYADIPRMASLGIMAVIQVYWHYREPLYFETLELPYLGKERAEKQYPLASLLKAGMRVAAASDCPVVTDVNPLNSIYTGVTRQGFLREYRGNEDLTHNKDESVSLEKMLKMHTSGVAYEMGREAQVGELCVGKRADMVILGSDIYSVTIDEIPDIPVKATVFDGKFVYTAEI